MNIDFFVLWKCKKSMIVEMYNKGKTLVIITKISSLFVYLFAKIHIKYYNMYMIFKIIMIVLYVYYVFLLCVLFILYIIFFKMYIYVLSHTMLYTLHEYNKFRFLLSYATANPKIRWFCPMSRNQMMIYVCMCITCCCEL